MTFDIGTLPFLFQEMTIFSPPPAATVPIFAVVRDGAVIALQENRPTVALPLASGVRFTWSVADVEGLSGQPRFWFTHPASGDTARAQLQFAGIAPEDFELGRDATLTVECSSETGAPATFRLLVVVRSIDAKDLTFFTPLTEHTVRICRAQPAGHEPFRLALSMPGPGDGAPRLAPAVREANGLEIPLRLADACAAFGAARESWLDLSIGLGGHFSRFRLRVATRPCRFVGAGAPPSSDPCGGGAAGAFPCAVPWSLVKGETLTLEIEGEPSGGAGFAWSLELGDVSGFRRPPVFTELGSGASVAIRIEDASELDWLRGTSGGEAELVITDGNRPASRLPVRFGLEAAPRRIHLAAGTRLATSGGIELEVAAAGDYLPVETLVDGTPELRLEDVPVRAVLAGAGGNLPAGEALAFRQPPPLVGPATVKAPGLTRGATLETDATLRNRVRILWADPPAHGNRSHVLKTLWQVPGVDRAFLYPPFALDGRAGLGQVGCALVAPGRRIGVHRRSALADEVRRELARLGSYTASYVIMDVDDVGAIDPETGRGTCQVDVELQLRLADEAAWAYPAAENLVVAARPDAGTLQVWLDPSDPDQRRRAYETLAHLAQGDVLTVLGREVTVRAAVPDGGLVRLAEPLVDADGADIVDLDLVGARLYPRCPLAEAVQAEVEAVFADLGTSETPERGGELPWQRRYPHPTFLYPHELRVAELYNRLMDLPGVADLRVVSPEANVAPPVNASETLASGERVHTASILSLRRLAVGPLRTTPGIDTAGDPAW